MALSKSRGRRPFDRDGERVVQVSMLRSDLMRTVDYLQHHFTAYDRNKVNVSINVNDCVSPLKLYSLDEEIELHIISFDNDQYIDGYLSTCWHRNFGSSFSTLYKKSWQLSQKEEQQGPDTSQRNREGRRHRKRRRIEPQYSVRISRDAVLPTIACQSMSITMQCPANKEMVLRHQFGTTQPRPSTFLIVARIFQADRRMLWIPLLILQFCFCFLSCCVAPQHRVLRHSKRPHHRRHNRSLTVKGGEKPAKISNTRRIRKVVRSARHGGSNRPTNADAHESVVAAAASHNSHSTGRCSGKYCQSVHQRQEQQQQQQHVLSGSTGSSSGRNNASSFGQKAPLHDDGDDGDFQIISV